MDHLWCIKYCQLFDQLSQAQLDRLERYARMRRFPKRSTVYLPADSADSVFLVASGRVKLSNVTSDGKEAILAFVEPGEIFGELSLVGEDVREEYAEAALDSTIVAFPRDVLEALMAESAPLTLGVSKLIGWRRRRIERRLKALLFRSNRDRLVHLILDLAEQYGQQNPDGVLLGIRLSHQELASIIGATRETVTVLLGQLQLEGFLNVSRQRVVIRDLPRLAQLVDGNAPKLPEALPLPARTPPPIPRPAQNPS